MFLEASKDCDVKKKLLVLLIAVIPTLMPNLVSAIAIDVEELYCDDEKEIPIPHVIIEIEC